MPVNDEGPHTAQLLLALRNLCGASEHLSHACADEQGLYLTDFRALVLIRGAHAEQRSMTAGELAGHLKLSSGAVTYLVERLSQSGHVTREVDPNDRRKVLLQATELGLSAAARFNDPLERIAAESTAQFSEQEVAAAISLLERVNEQVVELTHNLNAEQSTKSA